MSNVGDDISACGTFFAPGSRASDGELRHQVEVISKNPVVDGLMMAVQGVLAVLNEQRQILAVNDALIAMLGVEVEQLLGHRPGEAIGCVHSHEGPQGCGTSKSCSTCGAVVAMLASLDSNRTTGAECAIVAQRDGKLVDLCFYVQCAPLVFEGQRFLLLFLRDISAERQRAALEQVFFHDVSNVIESLVFASQRLADSPAHGEAHELAGQVLELASRLAGEVRIQRVLMRGPGHYGLSMREVFLRRIVLNLVSLLHSHPAAHGKSIRLASAPFDLNVATHPYLVERVLSNMLINALEATEPGGEVRLWMEDAGDGVVFRVWSRPSIPKDVARRVFQRNFTTKEGAGRGQGTYAMRLLGETYLGGQVAFTTSDAEGTVFHFRLPKKPPAKEP